MDYSDLYYLDYVVLPSPPYLLLAVGLFAGITSGLAFNASLKESVNDWNTQQSTRSLAEIRGPKLLVPFIGILCGICMFLAAGVQIFSFSPELAFALSVPLTVFTGILVWWQLGKILTQLEEGGSAALDLDSLF
ncbi:MAG: hypothetical protein AAGF24_06935 [Cyanobacteria bacterium P01_H01_bin.121]